jgi:CBS domain-containing protein
MSIENVAVSSVMVKDVKTVSATDSLQHACKVMQANKIGSVIVIQTNGESKKVPIGIITESDVVRHIALDPSRVHFQTQELMSHPLITVSPNISLRDALHIIVSKNIRRLPVVLDERLIGIITDKDIYRAIAKTESLLTSMISDELLMKHLKELEQPLVYKIGEILHKRLGDDAKD